MGAPVPRGIDPEGKGIRHRHTAIRHWVRVVRGILPRNPKWRGCADAGTLRRFLEQHGSAIDVVVLCVDGTDVGIYQLLLPLYFPRSKHEEEVATWQLPANVGGPNGEPLYPDRQIRIIDNPQHAALAGRSAFLSYLSSFSGLVTGDN